MLINLLPMSELDFNQFLDTSIDNYAKEKAAAGNWRAEEALEKSRQEFDRLLPEGRNTEGHTLYTIVVEGSEEMVGSLWVKTDWNAKEAFIYEFNVHEEKQGNGFGTEAINVLERILMERGITGLSLHVFAHNKQAIRLYERLGFATTNINMKKILD
ncbi:GNAT family N-acetyltransferase [Bacillus sp. es.036]|uniref:GNAT family N-acetyltransferase n=1 Tax=Bacillus sp. es.036 TaxID=1761764 RepID=UPI000BF3EF30|nr:GNAT family N-acetyltransferase [Bacillus sp. es.036]PFG12517.1 ribosomal protein S18 acetylase RimI-like enzyme [Bacillus sp. es.036]